MAWTLCTKSDVMSIHPTTPEVLQDLWSEAVEDLIRLHVDNPTLGVETVIVAEKHDGDGSPVLVTNNPGIVSVQAIRVTGAVINAADYVVYNSHIVLKEQVFPEGFGNVEIDYTASSDTVSALVRMTAAAMVVAILQYRKRAGADASIKWSSSEEGDIDNKSANMNVGLTSHLKTIMKRMLPREKIKLG